ncbi:helix-turn-helix domain-containing protein [Oceanobacillus halotolerans]|uniref:helix-turn-helix domain-containing protein n=1 Tax=Oceanobacillus halotolerans TaxID=2663380 RepID=UPI0013DC1E45|nr:helix-turn-helix transcriptional regulator [Oceanobacillus halotolerans]
MEALFLAKEVAFLNGLGTRLKEIRHQKALTQEELAHIAGFTRSYYTEVENGKRNISILNLYKLAHALEVSLVEIVDIDLELNCTNYDLKKG